MPKMVPRLSLPAITSAAGNAGQRLGNYLNGKGFPLACDGTGVELALTN